MYVRNDRRIICLFNSTRRKVGDWKCARSFEQCAIKRAHRYTNIYTNTLENRSKIEHEIDIINDRANRIQLFAWSLSLESIAATLTRGLLLFEHAIDFHFNWHLHGKCTWYFEHARITLFIKYCYFSIFFIKLRNM